MFGHNKIYTPKSYNDLSPNTLKVTSIFYTLQGEGPYSGQPAVFVRLTGCNLQCSFCDTYFDSGDNLTFNEIFEKIRLLIIDFYEKRNYELPYTFHDFDYNKPLLVLTGGEPLLQENVTSFIGQAFYKGYKVQIESNGTIERKVDIAHLVISPKINEKINRYVKPNPNMLERANTLKFVISKTMEGYKDIPDWAIKWYKDTGYHNPNVISRKLYVSPMNMYINKPVKIGEDGTLEQRSETDERISFWTPNLLDLKANQENHEYAAEIAMKYGVFLSLQSHLYASLP
jgi:7-carboxy-7-deazaguanine synthase